MPCYNEAENNDYDIIRFNIYEGNGKINLEFIVKKSLIKLFFNLDYLYIYFMV